MIISESKSKPRLFARNGQVAADLDEDWTIAVGSARFNTVFALDVLEHMKSPEHATAQIFSVMAPGGKLYASTGNVSYWIIRGIHMLGHFNYGRRGILDLPARSHPA